MDKKERTSMWHFDEDQKQQLWPIFEANDEEPNVIYSRTRPKEKLFITHTEKAKNRFHKFCAEIEPAIYAARTEEPTIGEKRKIQKRAQKYAEKLHVDLQKLDVINNDELFIGWMAVISLKTNLKMTDEELKAKSKKSSKYIPLAAAVGQALKNAGVEVSSYYADHEGKDKVAQVIEICIREAGLEPTENYEKLVRTAAKAAKQ